MSEHTHTHARNPTTSPKYTTNTFTTSNQKTLVKIHKPIQKFKINTRNKQSGRTHIAQGINAFWWQFEACINGSFEVPSGSRWEGCGRGSTALGLGSSCWMRLENVWVPSQAWGKIRIRYPMDMHFIARTAARAWRNSDNEHEKQDPNMQRYTILQVTMHWFAWSLRPHVCVGCQQPAVKA